MKYRLLKDDSGNITAVEKFDNRRIFIETGRPYVERYIDTKGVVLVQFTYKIECIFYENEILFCKRVYENKPEKIVTVEDEFLHQFIFRIL